MITEEVAQKFHTDDVFIPLRSASDWMKQIFNQSEALPDLGNTMSFYRETLVVEGDREAGARENRGREGYGRRERKGREAGEKFQKASFR